VKVIFSKICKNNSLLTDAYFLYRYFYKYIEDFMDRPLICLTLTGKTLAEDLALVNKYRTAIDVAELRADFLDGDERLEVRQFPRMAGIPCILTLRRRVDGGKFIEGEAARTILFARALSFADPNSINNYAYVDFEEDFHVPSLQDAALAFGTKIIRSVHDMEDPVANISQRLARLRTTGYEIPKIAFMPHTLDDVTKLFIEADKIKDNGHILIAMGPLGTPTRILSAKLGNYLTYTSADETNANLPTLGHMDPVTLNSVYHFKKLNNETKLYGITGWPLAATSSPALHNSGYEKHNLNSVYIPIRTDDIHKALTFAETVGIEGLSVTVPHKESVLNYVDTTDEKVDAIGACNTIVHSNGLWEGYNTDAEGFTKAILEFTGTHSLLHKKVAIIGAGGAAKAVAYSVSKLKGKACIFNRTLSKAKELAEMYNFKYSPLNGDASILLKKYSDIIIQTTSKGMNCTAPSSEDNDPLFFYDFKGNELLFDIIYVPEHTPVMTRAAAAGCKVCNGYSMLKYQGYKQFELFTGEQY
jgi:3-dehydroquinate dehydratase/shikimate dehydrogenase